MTTLHDPACTCPDCERPEEPEPSYEMSDPPTTLRWSRAVDNIVASLTPAERKILEWRLSHRR